MTFSPVFYILSILNPFTGQVGKFVKKKDRSAQLLCEVRVFIYFIKTFIGKDLVKELTSEVSWREKRLKKLPTEQPHGVNPLTAVLVIKQKLLKAA